MRIAAFREELEREIVIYALADVDSPLYPADRYHNVLVRMGERANLHLWGLDRQFVRVTHRILIRALHQSRTLSIVNVGGLDGRMQVTVFVRGHEESVAGVKLVNCDAPSVGLVLRASEMALHVCQGDIIDAE